MIRTVGLAALSALFLVLSVARAEDSGQRLFARNSLIGWDYGPNTNGWTIEAGRVQGSSTATPLVAGWTLGDFELSLHWKVAPGGQLKLTFPVVPGQQDRIADPYIAQEWHLLLSEGDSAGQLFDGTRLIALSKAPLAVGGEHTATLKRTGANWSLALDGAPAFEAKGAGERLGLRLSIPEKSAELWDLTLKEPAGESIFDGRDLSGWETNDPPEAWIVEKQEIVCTGKGRDYLRTIKDYDNFTFAFEYNLSRRGNSGIGIRTPRAGWPSGDGMELQLYDERPETPLNRHSTMAIYGNLEPLARSERPAEWNRAVVKAEGYVISAWVNGKLVQHANTLRLPELKHRHLKGWIGLQNHHSPIRYRNLTVLSGPPGTGLPEWSAPRDETASQVVLDRLMNTKRLAVSEGIESGSVTTIAKSSGKQVLADLKGPGALVELAAIGDSTAIGGSDIALYFDGEAKPRIKCPIRDLERRVTPISEGGLPILTYLPFQQSLRVELEASGPAKYRLDYLKLPASLPVTSFQDPEQAAQRGLLPAISYRHDQMDGGRHRELDPYPLPTSGQKTIKRGESVELLSISGAGVVDWWKLAPVSLLASDDLWIEITVDGEAEPAIQAPARFLFPGLGDDRDWHNFVLTHSDGAVNRLAMPFANGIRFAARYEGKLPQVEASLTASVHPAGDAELGRLRGRFTASGKAARVAGAGRLVGLVSQDAGNGSELRLNVDGSASETPLDLYLGVREGADSRGFLAGRSRGLAWRYHLLAPLSFGQSLEALIEDGGQGRPALILYYDQAR